ncbi:MAG: hypothetical protein ACYS7Y_11605 [Planctomycetota bacterium]|jgi:hypothetical protein
MSKEKKQPKDLETLTKAVQEIKMNLDHLVAAYGRNDEKRIFYWVGLISRQLTDVGRKMMGLEPLQQEGRAIELPKKDLVV